MCGIAGMIDRSTAGRVDPLLLRAMTESLHHRGPDSEGEFAWPRESPGVAFGVRRLSVIDLENGDQPIYNETGSLAIVCNGEIYNHVELRDRLKAQGHQFRTGSDSEVLLHLYEELGLDLFQELRGMYAFALWDCDRERLVLAVDPIGIKPLYVYESNGVLLFASEVKAFLADRHFPPGLNITAIDTYLTFGYMIGEDTLFSGVKRLGPGQALVLENGQEEIIEHWQAQQANYTCPQGRAVLKMDVEQLLAESVRLQMRSDVPLGLFLSGGVDSASILALMSRDAGPVQTYSVGYQGRHTRADDETAYAARTAAYFGASHHELRLSADEWWQALSRYAFIHDEPNANPSAISMLPLARLAARDVKVVLTGLGGDELFCGYPNHSRLPRNLLASTQLRRWLPQPMISLATDRIKPGIEGLYPALRRWHGVSGALALLMDRQQIFLPAEELLLQALSYEGVVCSRRIRERLYGDLLAQSQSAQHKEKTFRRLLKASADANPAKLVQRLILRTWLPGNGLLSLDKVTMACSLEARVPFFDQRLLATLLGGLNTAQSSGGKQLLRQAMQAYLPDEVLKRPKKPFSTPIRAWFDNELAERIQDILLARGSLERGLFRPQAVERLVRSHFSRRSDHTEMIFRLLLLELWQQAMLDRTTRLPLNEFGDA